MPSNLRTVLRQLAKSLGFTFTAIVTLALGIGANTALFGLIQGVLLTPPPFPQPEQLVTLRCKQPAMSQAVVADFHEYLDWKERTDLFRDVMVYHGFASPVLTDEAGSRPLGAHLGSSNYLRTLGLLPALGRDLTDADCVPGAAPVAIISHRLWQQQFRGDPAVVGRSVRLGGRDVTIVGVLPAGFVSITPGERAVDALLPLDYTRESARRGQHHLSVYARLQPGITVAQAEARMNDHGRQLRERHNHTHGVVTVSLADWSTQAVRPRLLALLGSVALVLLIACVNLANLQLVRLTGRTAEISIKLAIGASRGRVARELLLESAVIGVAGGLLGTLFAALTLHFAEDFIRAQFNTFAPLRVGGPALAFAGGITLLAILGSSLVPAWRATDSFEGHLRAIGRSALATPQQRRLNNLFVVAQVALTLLVLVGAGLLGRSLHRLITQEWGFATEHVSIFRVALPGAIYPTSAERARFFDQLLARLRPLPGVESAAVGDSIPLRTSSNGYFALPDLAWTRGQEPLVDKLVVSPDFFRTFGIPLLKGRDFDATIDRPAPDGRRPAGAVIINETFAKRYFGDRDPIGQPIGWNLPASAHGWDVIVGVVGDARMVSLDREVGPAMYASTTQAASPSLFVAVRSPLAPAALLPMVREQVRSLDAGIPVTAVRPMQAYVDDALAQRQLITWTIGAAALTALALAVLGLYSVIAGTVAQQTREIGVRMAIGAPPVQIRRWVLGRGLRLVAAGIVLGVGASFLVSRLLGTLVYGVPAWDPPTYAGVALLLTLTALLACWVPARRAARVDPLVALRAE